MRTPTFNPPEALPQVDCLAVQPDGEILVGGLFSAVNSQLHEGIARLTAYGAVTNYLTFDGSTITWVRGGSCAEVTRVHFDQFANGTWSDLGEGVRVPRGWQFTNVTLLPNATLRARGFVAVQSNTESSDWFDEATIHPIPITLGIGLNLGVPVLSLSGEVGKQYTIEVASQLGPGNAWSVLTTLSLTNDPQSFTDSSHQGQAQRFYRARLSP